MPVFFIDSMGQAPTADAFFIYRQWAQFDGPYLGGDVIGLLLGTVYALSSIISNAKSKVKSQAITLADKEEKSTFIYRNASGIYQSLTPRPKDTNGLTFSTVPSATGKYVKYDVLNYNCMQVSARIMCASQWVISTLSLLFAYVRTRKVIPNHAMALIG